MSCDGIELKSGEDYSYTAKLCADHLYQETCWPYAVFNISGTNHYKGSITKTAYLGATQRYYNLLINFSTDMINSIDYIETSMVSMTNIAEFYNNA